MFKFDFTSSSASTEDNNAGRSKKESSEDADRIVAKIVERTKSTAQSCTLLRASTSSSDKLLSCAHEHVGLHSSSIDDLYYILPQHTSLSEKNTDLIPGVYEGGLKVWECSIDLCRFLANIMDETLPFESNFKHVTEAVRRSIGACGSVFELGCGHALPACLLLRESVRRNTDSVLVFSDFNDFVLGDVTIPNTLLNACVLHHQKDHLDFENALKVLNKKSIYGGGDWMGLSHKLCNNEVQIEERVVKDRFDIILASETTYTTDSCQDTAYLMMKHLKVDIGVGLVATKRFYFGVGGGTDAFSQAADLVSKSGQSLGLRLDVRTIQSYDTGNANIRDLLEVRLVSN